MSDSVREFMNLGSYEHPKSQPGPQETHDSYHSGEYDQSSILTDDDLLQVQLEYKRKRLIESCFFFRSCYPYVRSPTSSCFTLITRAAGTPTEEP